MEILPFLVWPFVASLILTGIHAYLGVHVVERGVIFVDLALAQIAALGATIAILAGMDPHGRNAYWISLAFTCPGALIFSFTEGLIILSGCIYGVGLALVGVDAMTFKRPLFAGDTMRVIVDVTDTRATSKGDRGIVTFRHRVLNQSGEDVMECAVKRMLKGRTYK